MLRPNVVWFGERVPHAKLRSALKSAKNCDVFMVIGTSAIVQPAAALPVLAKQNEATVIEINKNRTSITPYLDIFLPGTAGKILPKLAEAIFGNKFNFS
jgi:NAD-dependent deacetylase